MSASESIVVLVTTSSNEEAEQIAEALVGERLAACVSIAGPVRSIYRWEGVVERSDEHLLLIKTRRAIFEALAERIRELHSYTTPEVIALPIEAGSAAYLAWLRDNCSEQ